MIVYQLTQAEYDALLKDLELEKCHTPDGLCATPDQQRAQKDAVEAMHRRFHYCVVRHLTGK